MSRWNTFGDADLSALKRVEFPNFDSFHGAATKIDLLEDNAAKVDLVGFWPARLADIDAKLAKLDEKVLSMDICNGPACDSSPNCFYEVKRTSSTLKQAQRGWLAKGLRDWTNYIDKAVNWLVVEVNRQPLDGVFDLRTFLHRRQMEGLQRRARWAGSRGGVRAWLRALGEEFLFSVAVGLRSGSGSKVLLALLKAPPGWTAAVRFRLDLEAGLPKMLERLAEVMAPNAPSVTPERRFVPGGNVA